MIFYCTTVSAHLTTRCKEGLLIRGIDEKTIFTVNAKNKWEACNKSFEKVNKKVNK